MKYDKIDSVLFSWASDNNLFVQTRYQDFEVRSIEIVKKDGKKIQIWIETGEYDWFVIKMWDYKKWKNEIKSDLTKFRSDLDNTLEIIKSRK